ncbi:MAG: hypothetical protein NT126_05755 [Bacteroidetes bacterium]|nr:hypothetical protein [Bacteroidota bacterium]
MKNILCLIAVLLFFQINLFAQCADSSDATLKETTDWITTKINNFGGRQIPPSSYKVGFDGSVMMLYEFGIDENFELKDTVAIVKINLKDFDLSKLAIRYINKIRTRFGISFEAKDNKMSYTSPTLGKIETGFEIIISSDKEPDLAERIVKAIKHGYCLSGGVNTSTIKEKF